MQTRSVTECRPSRASIDRLGVRAFPAINFAAVLLVFAGIGSADPVTFSKDIAPVLLTRCQGCHGPDKVKGGYRLDAFDKLLAPGSTGAPPVTVGEPARSELYRLLVTPDEDDRMPKNGEPLAAAEIDLVKRWIEQGAALDPGSDRTASLASLSAAVPHPAAPVAYARPVPVVALAFSPDGKTLAAGGYHEVTLWDAATGELRRRLGNLPRRIAALDFSPDGSRLAVAGGSPGSLGEVRVVDPTGSAPPRVLERISDVMLAVRFSPDGKRLAAGGADNVVRLYAAASGKAERTVEHHADWVLDLAFSPDGKWLASASRDKSARVISAETGEPRGAFLDHTDAVTGVGWSPDGERCLTAGRDRRLYAWDPDENENPEAKRHDDSWPLPPLPADPLRLTMLGDTLLVTCADGSLRALRRGSPPAGAPAPPADYGLLPDWPHALAAHAATGKLAAATHAGEVRVWSFTDAKPMLTFTAAPGCKPAGETSADME